MATVLSSPNPAAVFPRNHPRPHVRPRLVPECISVLSEDDETMDDVFEVSQPPPAKPVKPCAKNAIVNYVPKPAPAPAQTVPPARSLGRNRGSVPRAPRSKVVQPHRNALALHRPSTTIVKRQPGKLAVAPSAPAPRVSVDETRSVIEAAVRDAHLDRYMQRKDVLQTIACELRRRGYVDSVIELLMQTSYNLFDVNSVYYDTFEKQTVCVYKDGDWVPYTISHYNLFDGFQAYRINDQQRVERVSINNHVKWKWPE